jgi:hypothetical protein
MPTLLIHGGTLIDPRRDRTWPISRPGRLHRRDHRRTARGRRPSTPRGTSLSRGLTHLREPGRAWGKPRDPGGRQGRSPQWPHAEHPAVCDNPDPAVILKRGRPNPRPSVAPSPGQPRPCAYDPWRWPPGPHVFSNDGSRWTRDHARICPWCGDSAVISTTARTAAARGGVIRVRPGEWGLRTIPLAEGPHRRDICWPSRQGAGFTSPTCQPPGPDLLRWARPGPAVRPRRPLSLLPQRGRHARPGPRLR